METKFLRRDNTPVMLGFYRILFQQFKKNVEEGGPLPLYLDFFPL